MVKLKLLGGVSVEDRNGPLSGRITQKRRLAVLALLAVSPGGSTSRDKIVGIMWPESNDPSARHLLSVCVYDLRKALGENAVIAVGDDLRLNREVVATDVAEFEEAVQRQEWERAIATYAGAFLDGFFLSDAPEFDSWLESTRMRIGRSYEAALEAAARDRAARGDLLGSAEAWRVRATLEPLNSRVALAFMRALVAVGSPAGARKHAELHARVLREEGGMSPDPAVSAFAERLANERIDGRPGSPDSASHLDDSASVEGEAVERQEDSAAAPAALVRLRASPGDGAAPIAGHMATFHRGAEWRRRSVVVAASAFVALGLVGLAYVVRSPERAPVETSPATPIIAVLPFANLSVDVDDAFFSDGVAEQLISDLGQVAGLRVVARSSSFALKGSNLDAREIGRRLGADMVLDGSVRRSGARVRVTAELVNASTGHQLWSDRFDRNGNDVLDLQEEIARGIANALRVKLRPDESARLSRRETADTGAHALYLKARYVVSQRTRDAIEQGIRYYRQAIARDPTYARAYAGLAEAYTLLGYSGAVPQAQTQPLAKGAAERAIELDETLAEAHTNLAYVRESVQDFVGAQAALRRAIELQPSYAPAHHRLGYALTLSGRLTDGLAELRLAAQLDPLSAAIGQALGQALIFSREFDAAIRHLRQMLELDPNRPGVLFRLAYAYEEGGRYAEAIPLLERVLQQNPDDAGAMAVLAAAHARSGRRELAMRILDRLSARTDGLALIYKAGLLVVLGEADEGLRHLERVYQLERSWLTSMRVEPWLDPVRNDPRYVALAARMRFPTE